MKGFTLIELVLAILVISALGTLTYSSLSDQLNATRYEETRAKMDAIRTAILGDPSAEEQGHRTRFGYIGDMGTPPVTLDSLITRGSQPVFSFSATYGFGSGWRGPYILGTATTNLSKDAWGTSFTYSTNGSLTITSLGADKTAGGFLYNQDITIQIPKSHYLTSVQGFVHDQALRIGTVPVEIRYPVNGSQSWAVSTTDAFGGFSFANVPIGIRALSVLTPALGPKKITIDKPNNLISEETLNLAGVGRFNRTWGTQSGGNVGGGSNSTYRIPVVAESIMLSYNRPTVFLQSISFGSGGENLPNLAAGVKYKLRTPITINPGAGNIWFSFSGSMEFSLFFLTIFYQPNSINAQKDIICYNPANSSDVCP